MSFPVADLFVVLTGYWPHSAPDIDDPVAVAAHRSILDDLDPALVLEAARRIALEGREFCPPPGVLAAATKPDPVPPYFDDYVPELGTGGADPVTVKESIAEARAALRRQSKPVRTRG